MSCNTRHLKTRLLFRACLVLFILSSLARHSLSASANYGPLLAIPDLDQKAYIQQGDINIGHFALITDPTGTGPCHKELLSGSTALEYTEAVAFAVKSVNEDPNLLPNITLGFVQVDDCGNDNVALAKALSFLPRVSYEPETELKCSESSAFLNEASLKKHTEGDDFVTQEKAMPFYDVVGIISPLFSQPTVMVSKLLASARIPVIGSITTSDEFSDKSRHPYFSRLVSPDKYMVEAMLTFAESYDWSFVSVVYVHGSYGETAYENVKSKAGNHNICIATSHRVDQRTNYDAVVSDLLRFFWARVVLVFCYEPEIRGMFASVNKLNVTGHFIWIRSKSWSPNLRADFEGFETDAIGMFTFSYHREWLPELYGYIRNLSVSSSSNPWLRPVWEELAECSFSNNTCTSDVNILMAKNFGFTQVTSALVDAVRVFAHAVHNLLRDLCPSVTGPEARACITGDVLLHYLRNTSFNGSGGLIEFDKFGDVIGEYEIQQITLGYRKLPFVKLPSVLGLDERTIAFYDITTKRIRYTDNNATWDHLLQPEYKWLWGEEITTPYVPKSICSRPCVPGEIKIINDLRCCWDCLRCHDNERLARGNTSCRRCEPFTWPDPDTGFTTCRSIPVTYTKINDTSSLILICLASFGIILVTTVAVGFVRFRHQRVIKASSKELSMIQLVAVAVGFIAVILAQQPPHNTGCGVHFFIETLSYTSIYAPMIVKALRLYRIFLSDGKHNRKPRFVSPKSQVLMTGALILIQVVWCVIAYVMDPVLAKTAQPDPDEQFVELACQPTTFCSIAFLTYNILLLVLCLVLAFKTRRLPNDFNECWFIFICASATAVIWVAFVPSFFSTTRRSVQATLVSMSILINHTVTLIFLFLPKIYAAVFVPCEKVVIAKSVRCTNTRVTPLDENCRDDEECPPPGPSSRDSTE